MVPNSEKEMRIACEQWLEARARLISGSGAQTLEEYGAASEKLFAAFIRDFRSEDFAVLVGAFRSFRGRLAEASDGSRGYPAWWPETSLQITG
jgi:hypothetical protein